LKNQFKPRAEEEVTRLQEFARSEGFTDKLQMWDLPYWRRRQKQHMFKYSWFSCHFLCMSVVFCIRAVEL